MPPLFFFLCVYPSEMLLLPPEMTNYLWLYFLSPHSSSCLPSVLIVSVICLPLLSSFFFTQASKIDSLRSKVDLLRLPLALSSKTISEHKSQLGGVWEKGGGGSGVRGVRKPHPPPASNMDNESTYSGYSYRSSHSRSSRKHRLGVDGMFCMTSHTNRAAKKIYLTGKKTIFQFLTFQILFSHFIWWIKFSKILRLILILFYIRISN